MLKFGRLSFGFLLCALMAGGSVRPAYAENLIQNGTFNDGFANWSQLSVGASTPGFLTIGTGSVCGAFHTGNAASFNEYGNRRNALEQTVVIPGNSTASLSFKVWGQLDPTSVIVKVLTSGNFSTTLDNFVASRLIQSYTLPGPVFTCTGNTFETKTYDMTSYTGQQVTIHLEATSSGFDGTFAMIDDVELNVVSGGGVPPTPTPGSGKRQTAMQLFCNRGGVNLETATCSATVADKGDRPLQLPTGQVNFVSRDGFSPSSASCQLVQTQYSPGIASCQAQFAVPSGFTIGAKFPIDASYDGDSAFDGSSTSHYLIQAGCVSIDPKKPCPDSVGITFVDFPKIDKDKRGKFILTIGCSSKSTNPNVNAGNLGGVCQTTLRANVDMREILETFTYGDWQALSAAIPEKTAKSEAFARVAVELGRLTPTEFATLHANSKALDQLAKDIAANKLKKPKKGERPLDPYFKIGQKNASAVLRAKKNTKPRASLTSKVVEGTVPADSQKEIGIALGTRIQKIAALLQQASLLLPMEITAVIKQKNRKGTAKFTEEIEILP